MNELLRSKRPDGQKGIVRAWVCDLEPRMQGVLLTAIRGADTSPRENAIKKLCRFYRGTVIHGKNDNPGTFVQIANYDCTLGFAFDGFGNVVSPRGEVSNLMESVLADHDEYPHHYLMHLVHAAQIVGEYHPVETCRKLWGSFYVQFCRKLHVNPETREQLEKRLGEPSEAAFVAAQ